jgi:hypothetical protein
VTCELLQNRGRVPIESGACGLPSYIHVDMSAHFSIVALDARIDQLKGLERNNSSSTPSKALITLKKERNALTPICAAPDEIIVRILANLTNTSRSLDSFFRTEWSLPSREWLAGIAVCSRLWTIGLNSPELWSFLDGSASDKWLRTCMERAVTYPLKVSHIKNTPFFGPDTKELLSSVLRKATLAEIVFAFDRLGGQSFMNFLLNSTFPSLPTHLEHLQVSCTSGRSPSTFFLDGKCDNLVELSLTRFILVEHPTGSRLKHLKLDTIYHSNDDYVPVLKWLRSLPLLEVLILEHTGLRGNRNQGVDHEVRLKRPISIQYCNPKATMPFLRVLSLKEDLSTIWFVLEALPVPSQALSITVAHEYHQHLYIPIQYDSIGLQERVFAYVKRFWKQYTGRDLMPSGRLIFVEVPIRIQFGVHPRASNSSSSLFYETTCTLRDADSILATIDTVSVALWNDEYEEQYEENEELQFVALGPTLELVDQMMLELAPASIRHILIEH